MLMFTYETVVDPLLKSLRRFTPVFFGMKAGDKVVDVCCGTGAQVLEYERLGIIATGLDNSPDMLKIALKNKARQNATNAIFQLGDAVNMPFPNGHFDYATISLALHDKEEDVRYRIISEMKRVVKKEGYLVLIDYQVPLPENVWGAFVRAIEFLAGGSHYGGFKNYLSNKGMKTILNNCSLSEEKKACRINGLIELIKVNNC
jgi:ubiquinone/menaquinone biosynthesis C-methylase UbiE